MRRLLMVGMAIVCLGCVGLVGTARFAHADGFFWDDDPIVTIDGSTVNIQVGIASTGLGLVSGTVPVAVVIPDASSGSVTSIDTQFFVPVVQFFHVKDSQQIAAFLGVSQGQVSSALHPVTNAGASVEVFSVVHSAATFPTILSAAGTTNVAASNQLMEVTFALPGH